MAQEWQYFVKVFAYVNPVELQPVNPLATWYVEKKIVETGRGYVIALRNGKRVQYSITTYWFRKVKQEKIPALIQYIQNNAMMYPGWIHHANVYTGKTKRYLPPQLKLDFEN